MTTHFHTEIAAGPIQRAPVNTALGDLDQEIYNTQNGVSQFTYMKFPDKTLATISAGVLTPTSMFLSVNAETGSADDLDSIATGTYGNLLILTAATGDTITVKNGTGNIILNGGESVVLSGSTTLVLVRDNSAGNWRDMFVPHLHELNGTAAPTATDDAGDGYREGSLWVDETNDEAYILVDASTGAAVWKVITGGESYVKLADLKTKGTSGGTTTTATWHTRTLNTEIHDTGGVCTLLSNQFRLSTGTYRIRASAPAYASNRHHILLWNSNTNAQIVNGDSAFAGASDNGYSYSVAVGEFTVTDALHLYDIRHYIETGAATFGLGIETNANDPNAATMQEVYAVVELWKVS